MKKSTILFSSLLLVALAATLLIAAGPMRDGKEKDGTPDVTVAGAEVPELLQRGDGLGSLDEFMHVNNLYRESLHKVTGNPKDGEAYLQLAEIFMNEARITGEHPYYYPAALDMIEAALSNVASNRDLRFRALYMKASVQLSLHHFRDALTTGEQALSLNPYNAGIYGVLVDAHVELGDYAKAVEMADKMVAIRPDLRSYSRVSYLRELHGDVAGAIEAMKLAVSAGFPGYEQTAWCRTMLAGLYERYGDLPNAEMQYRITLGERPDYPFAIAGLASVEMKKGNLEKAEEYLEAAAGIIPEVGFFADKARLMMKKDENEKAAEQAGEVLEMLAEDAEKGHNMDLEYAHVYLELRDDPAKALEFAMKEYAVRPDNIQVNAVLAEIHHARGDLAKAAEHADKALATGTQDPHTLCLAGLIRAEQGATAEGRKLIRTALEHDPLLSGAIAEAAKAHI